LQEDAKKLVLDEAIDAIAALRSQGVRIHSITNTVAQNFTANILLACNTKPSMTVNPDEVEAFTSRADALHINLGTLDKTRIEAIHKSIDVAQDKNIPITLDPVMTHVSPLRAKFAKTIMDKTQIIRGNEHEIKILGLDSSSSSCIVMTGEKDKIMHGQTELCIENGHPIMAQVIATGCALGALITALASKTKNPASASLASLLWFGIAGEIAASKANGPGSFSPIFIDTLNSISLDELRQSARLS